MSKTYQTQSSRNAGSWKWVLRKHRVVGTKIFTKMLQNRLKSWVLELRMLKVIRRSKIGAGSKHSSNHNSALKEALKKEDRTPAVLLVVKKFTSIVTSSHSFAHMLSYFQIICLYQLDSSSFSSFSNLWVPNSRLYRRRCLQPNTHSLTLSFC